MYGHFRLIPSQVEGLSLIEISEMVRGLLDWMEMETDRTMQVTAWQTALLMTASGNYKRGVKPEKLYEPLEKRKKKENQKKSNKASIAKQREELKELFGLQGEGSSEG